MQERGLPATFNFVKLCNVFHESFKHMVSLFERTFGPSILWKCCTPQIVVYGTIVVSVLISMNTNTPKTRCLTFIKRSIINNTNAKQYILQIFNPFIPLFLGAFIYQFMSRQISVHSLKHGQ